MFQLLRQRQFRLVLLILLQLQNGSAWIQFQPLTPGVRKPSSTLSVPTTASRSHTHQQQQQQNHASTIIRSMSDDDSGDKTIQNVMTPSRRAFVSSATAAVTATIFSSSSSTTTSSSKAPFSLLQPQSANAIGPVKIELTNPIYTAQPCPKDRPIPGEKAMKGMRGLCVTVEATLADQTEKPLSKVGVYGFITDVESGESVLANNPDFGTDAGQFAMIETVTPDDRKLVFEFIAAVPMEKDLSKYENGIGPLQFDSLRIISFPGGQQFGAISPCEMNEFSDECEAWEAENGPFERGEYMVRPNSRTKGR